VSITVDVVVTPPKVAAVNVSGAPTPAVIVAADMGSVPISYAQLPREVQTVPASFPFTGKPDPGLAIHLPMGYPMSIPAALAGTATYARVAPSATATFTLNQISGITVTLIGTITLLPNGGAALAGPGALLAAGDVLQLITPTVQDATLTDVGITVMIDRE
jgi:hypothetical protein